jgi:predicted ATPase
MITSVTIENFKNLRHQEIALEPLTVFVGPNGSGKTSVLEAIHLAALAMAGMPAHVFASERPATGSRERGQNNGLRDYFDEIKQNLVPLITGREGIR